MMDAYSKILRKLADVSVAWKAQFQEPHGQYWLERFFDRQYPDLPLEWKIRDGMLYLDGVWICPVAELDTDTLGRDFFVTPVSLELDLHDSCLTVVITHECGEFEISCVERSVYSRETREARLRKAVGDLEAFMAKQMEDPEYRAFAEEMDIPVKLADAILAARLQRNMTQQELADAAGVKQKTISALESFETKRVSFQTLKRIADGLNMDLNVSFLPREETK